MIGDSPVFIDPDDNITVKEIAFRGMEWLWGLQSRKNVKKQLIGKRT